MASMLRIRAVRELLVGDVAGVHVSRPDDEPADSDSAPSPTRSEDLRYELDRAARKALGMVVLAVTAVAVLLLTHPEPGNVWIFEGEELVFTLGILLIVGYGGYRLGQWEKYRSVARALDEIDERTGKGHFDR